MQLKEQKCLEWAWALALALAWLKRRIVLTTESCGDKETENGEFVCITNGGECDMSRSRYLMLRQRIGTHFMLGQHKSNLSTLKTNNPRNAC